MDKVVTDWSKYPNFSKREFDCKHTGQNQMSELFMDKLQQLRTVYNKPIVISSGYRAKSHPVEVGKTSTGNHSKGIACDIVCHSDEAYEIIGLALALEFTGIGVSQRAGRARFIHLDLSPDRKAIWSY